MKAQRLQFYKQELPRLRKRRKELILERKGRLKFGGAKNSAPFPSMIVIFNKPTTHPEGEGVREGF